MVFLFGTIIEDVYSMGYVYSDSYDRLDYYATIKDHEAEIAEKDKVIAEKDEALAELLRMVALHEVDKE